MAKLVVRTGRNAGAEFKLDGDRLVMGRRSANAVHVMDAKASREHAVILRKGSDFFLQDLSRNGTLLNGMPASKQAEGSKLKFGDQIKIGDTTLEMIDEKAERINIDIPGYQIFESIGSGGMGTVYKAKQLSMDRIVALKVLNERYSAKNEFVERFNREARAAGKLNHPNVIHVHDISRTNGRHYFSMEYIDGPSVKELLRTKKKVDVNQALDIALQAAKALEFAHENNIVHRDIKPDNIMLTKEGVVKLADLGIAKNFEETGPAPSGIRDKERRVLGTPHYMAPEQALGKAIDHRVDIYSLGATLYHMVTGSTPFAGQTPQEILKKHIQESLPPIQEFNPSVPDPVCFIIERMMAKLPEKRYRDMTSLIADIERVQRGKVEGIDRIEAGDSSIMPVAKAGKGAKPGQAKSKAAEVDEEEEPTGSRRFISNLPLYATLVLVFIAVTLGVILVLRHFGNQPQNSTNNTSSNNAPNQNQTQSVSGRSNPDAKRLLQSAVAAKQADPSEYERLLREIENKYPTSLEAEDARKQLEDYMHSARDQEKKAADAALADAKAFESANPESLEECVNRYRKAVSLAQNVPSALADAKAGFERLKKRQDDEHAKAVETAYKVAFDAAATCKSKSDFDGARRALQDVMAKYDSAPQKSGADAELARINADAQARLKQTQDAAASMELAQAKEAWNKYATDVKDSTTSKDVEAAKQALDEKAQNLIKDELAKSSEKAKMFEYIDAIGIARVLQEKLKDTTWAEQATKKQLQLKLEKDLHEKVLNAMQQKLKSGPIPLNFPIQTRLGTDIKWALSGVTKEQLNFDPVASGNNPAPGFSKRLKDFSPKEQYNLYLLCLPKPLTIEDHRALSAFCAERDLTAEAQSHDEKASEAPRPN